MAPSMQAAISSHHLIDEGDWQQRAGPRRNAMILSESNVQSPSARSARDTLHPQHHSLLDHNRVRCPTATSIDLPRSIVTRRGDHQPHPLVSTGLLCWNAFSNKFD
jgi:hypothetical protein